MNHASLFSGIGGFDLAAEWMGWNNVFNCEWEEFPQQVLKHHFPNTIQHGDIKELDATAYAGRIDILTGGFPCQPYSLAGKRKGKEDERHLWPEMLRVIRECAPRYVVGENVRGLVGWNGGLVFEEVCVDLEAQGYAVQPFLLPAAGVGSCPHRRDRVWFVAHCEDMGQHETKAARREWREQKPNNRHKIRSAFNADGRGGYAADTDGLRLQHTQESGSVGQSKGEARRRATKSAQADGGVWDASDTASELFKRNESGKRRAKGEQNLQQENGATNTKQSGTMGKDGNASDTRGERPSQPLADGKLEGRERSTERSQRTTWDRFPTVSPVCGGDDGLPKELDGLTFSKWRRESIKAYGNAIVPQVALQIFKAINLYENGANV